MPRYTAGRTGRAACLAHQEHAGLSNACSRQLARRRPQLHYQHELFTVLHTARHELLVPATVIAEVGYFLAREAGAPSGVVVPTVLADGDFAPST